MKKSSRWVPLSYREQKVRVKLTVEFNDFTTYEAGIDDIESTCTEFGEIMEKEELMEVIIE